MSSISKKGSISELGDELDNLLWRVKNLGHKDELDIPTLEAIIYRIDNGDCGCERSRWVDCDCEFDE